MVVFLRICEPSFSISVVLVTGKLYSSKTSVLTITIQRCQTPYEQILIIPAADTQKLHLFPFICKHILSARSSPLRAPACTVGGVNTLEGRLG